MEREQIRLALEAATRQRARVVALEGPPGSGKSALLDLAVRAAPGFTEMRTVGATGEQDVPFGSLLTLVRPHLTAVDELADVPRNALLGALALAPPTMADRLAIGAAVLQLIGLLAELAPVLVIVDDLQWVDPASRDAILFALRRIRDDRVAALLGVREGAGLDLRAFEVLPVGPLTPEESVELLRSRHAWSGSVAADVARRCEGNPLALLEVGETLTEGQRRGLDNLPDRLPAGNATIGLFHDQIDGLPGKVRFALLVAALSHDPGQGLVAAACREAGDGEPDWDVVEAARLIVRRGDRLEFTHPLAQSAVVALADAASIRSAHRALAAAVDDPIRRTWHLAEAATGSDAAIALELEQLAVDAVVLGDPAASHRAAIRAAELSESSADAARRWLLAARSASVAGLDPTEAIDRARAGPPEVRTEAIVLQAATSAWSGRTQVLQGLLRDDLARLEVDDAEAAALVCAFAAISAFNEMDAPAAMTLGERAWTLAGERFDIDHPFGLMPGVAMTLTTQFGAHRNDELLACRVLVEEREDVDLATPVAAGLLLVDRHDDALAFAHAMHAVAVRDGRVVAAAWTATACGMASSLMGDLSAAVRWCTLGRDLGQAVGVPYVVAQATSLLASVAALQGDRDAVAALTSEVDAAPLCNSPLPTLYVRRFASILDELHSGSLETAVEQLRAFPDVSIRFTEHWPVPYELLEALVRLDRLGEARAVMPAIERIGADPYLQHHGQIERCRGLVAPPDRFDGHFQEAIRLLQSGPRRIELARTRLCYGERLVQVGRRNDALEPLRAALEVFDATGCRPWADRARIGLSAAGGRPKGTAVIPTHRLTTQEEQVAHAVASGMTNREAAAALFVSPKTIETHLTRIYRKLGVRSRTELANVIWGRALTDG